jgi:hypothetical protein
MRKEKKPDNTPVEGISKIRYKVWDINRHYYLGGFDEYKWWMVRDARRFLRTDIRARGRKLEIHQTEEITIQKSARVVK